MNNIDRNSIQVIVNCFTYNHKPYIEDALNGFCMQETKFPFVCNIVDDASTDGEQKIIKDYLGKHFNFVDCNDIENETDDYIFYYAQHKHNNNCFFAVYLLNYNHYSLKKPKMPYLSSWMDNAKYVALCEGDDYWITPHKLQKQVEYMEAHPDCSLCFHANRYLYSNGIYKDLYLSQEDKNECPIGELIMKGGGIMSTASMMYLKTARDNYPTWPRKSGIGDAPLMLVLAERGKVAYLNEVMCVYRVSTSGSWTQRVVNVRSEKRKHYKRIKKMWNDYDEWSNYKHHKYVVAKKIKNAIHYHINMIKLFFRGK